LAGEEIDMGKLHWVPLLILIALLACDAAAAESPTALAVPLHPRPAYGLTLAPSSGGLVSGPGDGGGLAGLQGDPDDLIDGNRAKPKPATPILTGTGGSMSIEVLWMRLCDYVLSLCRLR
jgi:hypothetical protein